MRPQAAVDWWLMKPLHFFVKRDVSSWFTRFITPPPARTKYKNVLLLKIFLFGLVLDHMSLMFDCKPYFAVKCLVSRFSSNGGLVAAGALVREWMGGGSKRGDRMAAQWLASWHLLAGSSNYILLFSFDNEDFVPNISVTPVSFVGLSQRCFFDFLSSEEHSQS